MDTDCSSDAKNLVPASSREAVLASFDDGVASIAAFGKQITLWDTATPCAAWDLRDLVGHLLAIIRYYHRVLDTATSSSPESALPRGEALAAMNASDLAALPEHEGPERLGLFVELAGAYRSRLEAVDWDLVLGRWLGLGALNVGEHRGSPLASGTCTPGI